MSEKYFNGKRMVDADADLAEAIEDLQESAGVAVVANPEGEASADLTKLQVGEAIYGIPAKVEANPEASATANLGKLKVGSVVYAIPAELPSLPADANEKTYILKAVNGTLSWVEEEAQAEDENQDQAE